LFFTTDCLPLDYDANAPKPERWLQFLEELWPGDGKDFDMEAESTLQDMFGYLLTPDTRQQKIFLIVGPGRSGKGTIVWALVQLLGGDNCAFHTHKIAELLLSISGGDPQTINRKNQAFWNVTSMCGF
jgi:putative DNA primase/helicase